MDTQFYEQQITQHVRLEPLKIDGTVGLPILCPFKNTWNSIKHVQLEMDSDKLLATS